MTPEERAEALEILREVRAKRNRVERAYTQYEYFGDYARMFMLGLLIFALAAFQRLLEYITKPT